MNMKKYIYLILILPLILVFSGCLGSSSVTFSETCTYHSQMSASVEYTEFFTDGNFRTNLSNVKAKMNTFGERYGTLTDQIEQTMNYSALALNRYKGILLNPSLTGKDAGKDAKNLKSNLEKFYSSLIDFKAQKNYIETLSIAVNSNVLDGFIKVSDAVVKHLTAASKDVIYIFKKYISSKYPVKESSTSIVDGYMEIEVLDSFLNILYPSYTIFASELRNSSMFAYGGVIINSLTNALTRGAQIASVQSSQYNNKAQGILLDGTKAAYLILENSLSQNNTVIQFAPEAIKNIGFSSLEQKVTEKFGSYTGNKVLDYLETKEGASIKGHYKYLSYVLTGNFNVMLHSIYTFLTHITA